MKYLLDTCVLSELAAKRPDPKVVEFVDSLDDDDVYLSVITIGEIVKGIEKLPASRRKQELRAWLNEDLQVRFQGKIIPINEEIIVEWGILTARVESAGRPMPAIDSLLAATAQAWKMTLVTRNEDDFDASGVNLVNPWKA